MIDNIAKTMKELENIVIDYYSESDESEQLSERQQLRLEQLKKKKEKMKRKEDTRGTRTEKEAIAKT